MGKITQAGGIRQEYEKKHSLYMDCASTTQDLIEKLLQHEKIAVHSVNHRVKALNSLLSKFERPGKAYSMLSDVTDIVGIRIITYFSDDVDRVASVITKEFNISKEQSIDKRQTLGDDRFGYQSLHFIVQLRNDRCGLPEYCNFAKIKMEIQIRSILQHAWAEIEHDLGYKTQVSVPHEIRRKFALVSGLLEVADNSFVELRNSLSNYEQNIHQKIFETEEQVELNLASLKALLEAESNVAKLDQNIALIFDSKLTELKHDVLEKYVERLTSSGITDIQQLEETANTYKIHIEQLARKWASESHDQGFYTIAKGIGIFYLLYFLCAKKGAGELINYIKKYNIGDQDDDDYSIAEEIMSIYDRAEAARGGKR